MPKISAEGELTSVADGDLLAIVDVSDTTDGASGTTKKITKANLTAGLGGGTISGGVENRIVSINASEAIKDSGLGYGSLTYSLAAQPTIALDGATDDASALATLLSSWAADSIIDGSGGTLKLDSEVTISKALTFRNCRILRSHNGNTFDVTGGSLRLENVIETDSIAGTFVQVDAGVTFGTIKLANCETKRGRIIIAGNGGSVHISDCQIGDGTGEARISVAPTTTPDTIDKVHIVDNYVCANTDNTQDLIKLSGAVDRAIIMGNTTEGGPADGYDLDQGGRQLICVGNRSYNAGNSGFEVKQGSARHDSEVTEHVVFANNMAVDSGANGFSLRVQGYYSGLVAINPTTRGIFIDDDSGTGNIIVDGFEIREPTSHAIQVNTGAGSDNITICNGLIEQPTSASSLSAINVQQGSNVHIYENTFIDITGICVRFNNNTGTDSTGCVVRNNRFGMNDSGAKAIQIDANGWPGGVEQYGNKFLGTYNGTNFLADNGSGLVTRRDRNQTLAEKIRDLNASDLVALWVLDDSNAFSGTTAEAQDVDGYDTTHDGTYSAAGIMEGGYFLDGRPCPLFDAASHIDVYSATMNTVFGSLSSYTFGVCVRIASAEWSDATNRNVVYFSDATAQHIIEIQKRSTTDQLRFRTRAGGTEEAHNETMTAQEKRDWVWLHIVRDEPNDSVKYYINGSRVYSGSTVGTWGTPTLSSSFAVLGAVNTSSAAPFDGLISNAWLSSRVLDEVDIAYLSEL